MNEDPNQPQSAPLQFEKAEFVGQSAPHCAVCNASIAGEYYQANGQIICPSCTGKIKNFGSSGDRTTRFAKALAGGIVAGFVGFLLHYMIFRLWSLQLGLVAVVVGWMVGSAVRWGAEMRGGIVYQLMAAAITYIAACATYLPFIIRQLAKAEHGVDLGTLVFAFIYSLAEPWLEGPSNIIGWAILGFAVYQAWIMNRKPRFEVSGPFFTRQSVPPAAP